MRRKEHRLKVRRLFLLGAGASFCVSSGAGASEERQAPLDRDFCGRLLKVKAINPKWVGPCRDFVRREWLDEKPFPEFGLEQAVLRQLGHLEFIDAIHPRRRKTSLTDFEYMNELSHLICFVLRRARENTNGAYSRFANKVFPASSGAGDIEDRVITFNYDELLEKNLFDRYKIREIYFDRLADAPRPKRRTYGNHPFPLVVKLHGSVNWRCYKQDFENIVRCQPGGEANYSIDPVWFSSVGTPSPTDQSSPLIMPPLPVKPITHVDLFRFLWTTAYEYLHEARELVICGYSLPDADRMAQSMFANFSNKSVTQITVVEPNPAVLSKWRALLRRKNVNNNARWTYYEDFDEYVDAM
jgi:hypothetical protein